MPKCVTSLTANAAVEARPHCTNPVGWHFGSDCLRKDNRVGHVTVLQQARHSYVMKFLLVELSQLRSSVVRAPARKAEDLGFDSRAGHTLFA